MGYDIVLSDHVLDHLTIHGKSMATTNDEFTETALQRFSKTEKRFNLKMTRTLDSKEKLKRGSKTISFHNALIKKKKKK